MTLQRILSLTLFLFLLVAARPVEATICRPVSRNPFICAELSRRPAFSLPEPRSDSILSDAIYGWVEDYARFYESPGGARLWQPETGFFYGVVDEVAQDPDGAWYKVCGDWLPERYFHIVEAGTFGGIEVNRQPQRPFGWVLRPVQPRPAPGAEVLLDTAELQRYDFVEIHDAILAEDGSLWYDVGEERWVLNHMLALTEVRERPEGVAPGDFWVDVDLTEQAFAAYEGDRMVYAGLLSSGLPRWPTHLGLYTVWERHLATPMEGGTRGDDYYYIEAVPHTMYFDGDIALHGAYWHDDFGRPKSHGCVNMPLQAAQWVFYWSENAPNDLRVWVHTSGYADFLR